MIYLHFPHFPAPATAMLAVLLLLLRLAPAAAEPFAYIPNAGDDTVSVIDLATNQVVATVAVGDIPTAVAVKPDGASVYVLNQTAQTVSVIDTASNVETATIPVGATPFGVAVTPDGTRAYVANRDDDDGTLTLIDLTTNTVLATIVPGFSPVGVALSPDGSRLYVPLLFDEVAVIETATNTEVARVSFDSGFVTSYLAVSPSGDELWVSKLSQSVEIIDTASNSVVGSVAVGAPTGIAFSPDGSRAYVGDGTDGTVAVIDTATRTVLAKPFAGFGPLGVDVAPDGSRYYVAASQSDWVAAFDAASDTLIEFVAVGDAPNGYGSFITPLPGVGGEVVQQTLVAARCANLTTPQTVIFPLPAGARRWDCEAEGLGVASGDLIRTLLFGAADAQPGAGGTVRGQTLLAAVCINVTQSQVVSTGLLPSGTTSWDCSAAGLAVNPGDQVRTLLIGAAD